MHFNTKYINRGDSEKEIKDKVNYNFNQVLSFAVGHEGYIGPKGATGIPGPSGKIGATGNTGDRASEWFRGTTFPSQTPQEFDLWVDDSSSLGDIYKRNSSSWSYTGLSLFNSDYFEVYSGIVGPLGLTNKSAIGFNSTYTPDQTSLVISDTYFSTSDVNPNNSKLLISTEDQINTPILSFSKSNGGSTIDFPSFYWKNTGTLSNLIFKSPGKLSINSLLDLEISSDDPTIGGSLIIKGNSFSSTTQGNLNLIGDDRIKLITDSSINPIIINSLNFGVNESKLYTKTLTKISWNVGDYALKSTPVTGSTLNYFGGISVNSDPTTSKVFDFTGMDGHSVLYGLPLGSVTSGNHKQTVFGASGGATAGSTGAPYSYHVKRLNNISVVSQTNNLIKYSGRNNNPFLFPSDFIFTAQFLDLTSPSYWSSNMLVVTSSVTADQYILIPSSSATSFEPLFYSGEGNEYRVYLNDTSGSINKIKGIVFPYYRENLDGSILTIPCAIDFASPCSYIDLFWAYVGSPTNPNGRIFWKTCSGSSGVLEVTNQFTVSGNSVPASSSR
jgi:hypothetical protein